jgi:pSer/pThr/pTyr-binding forkhead associated (FHA) protein
MAGVEDRTGAAAGVPLLDAGRYLAVQDAVLPLTADVVRVGRSLVADVHLDDATVSRRHAIVVRRGDETVVLDDRSRNGVFVNGERVTQAVLRDGDVIQLGRVTIRFVEVGEPIVAA